MAAIAEKMYKCSDLALRCCSYLQKKPPKTKKTSGKISVFPQVCENERVLLNPSLLVMWRYSICALCQKLHLYHHSPLVGIDHILCVVCDVFASDENVCVTVCEKELGLTFHSFNGSQCLCVSVHRELGVGVSPHRVCVSGTQPTRWRGPWGRCDSAEGSPCDVLMSVCVVCRLERFARYLGRREGGRTGVRVGDRKQRWSALCPHWLMEMGREGPPLPTSANRCHD